MYDNYFLKNIPERTIKPREFGSTMVMDKGLSLREVENFLEVASNFVDIVKLGWATSYVTPNLKEKIKLYKDAGIPVYFGGTLFEAFIVRDQFKDYLDLLDKYELDLAEVSDGSINIDHKEKCDYISEMAQKVTVLSEVGSKDADKIIPPYVWIQLMKAELEAGAWKVIGESREAGNVGLFRSSGEVRSGLVQEILSQIPAEKILWEAPQKSQQVFFVQLCGPNVNLGNISPQEAISLETIRLGLRSDTFDDYLADDRKY